MTMTNGIGPRLQIANLLPRSFAAAAATYTVVIYVTTPYMYILVGWLVEVQGNQYGTRLQPVGVSSSKNQSPIIIKIMRLVTTET